MRREGPARRRALRARLALLLVGLTAAVVLLPGCGGGGGGGDQGETIRFVIPAGASKDLARGESVPGVPSRIEATVGDTLVVENKDSTTQFVSGFAISPGQTVTIPLAREGTYLTRCSAHKDKSIKMVVKA